ncbi:MAG TPA: hypothetical protein VLA62_07800, partial [Solirubrobacterales bacterium]|nr:hypothetical protein [Solirubrobacterales bacterium]
MMAASVVSIASALAASRLSAEAVFAAARRELEYGPDPALDQVFTPLSLVLEREPLEVAALAL